MTDDEIPTTLVAVFFGSVELMPSWPNSFSPQHFTAPAGVIAHVCSYPTEIARTLTHCASMSQIPPPDAVQGDPGILFVQSETLSALQAKQSLDELVAPSE